MTADEHDRQPNSSHSPGRWSAAQWGLVGVIVSLALGMGVYRWLHSERLDESAALFIGLPTILAVALTLTPKAKSATGMIMKGMTIALLMSGPVLKEGLLCVLFASPLFYLVGAIVGWAIDRDRRRRREGQPGVYSLVLIPLLLASLEGVSPALTLGTRISVQAERMVPGSAATIEARLSSQPEFSRPLPAFLRVRFPRPSAAEGEGLSVGDRRTMVYPGKSGVRKLVFVVAERSPGYVRFRAVSDDTKIGTWLTWQDAEVRWVEATDGTTRVQWTLHFDRRLSPAWYFGPLQSFGASEAAGYLIDALATP